LNTGPSLTFDNRAAPGTGVPPFLLVHGLRVNRNIRTPNAALAHHLRLIRVDLAGRGQSPMPKAPERSHPEIAIAEVFLAVRVRNT